MKTILIMIQIQIQNNNKNKNNKKKIMWKIQYNTSERELIFVFF